MNTKYLSLTAALLVGCSNSLQQAKITSTPAPKPTQVLPDCRSLDLTQKVGFHTSFTISERRFCYAIASKENHYYDKITECDSEGMPLPQQGITIREFAGPNKGSMELIYILKMSGNDFDYIPFWRDASGKISTLPSGVMPENIGKVLDAGKNMLDVIKTTPEVCQQLLEYKPSTH
ncbi:MAG: hypothetical protein Q8R47_02295 [Nanoarchaeota archaeon]|nr:hypothetical protein [Nanoarchaeota archaeon]